MTGGQELSNSQSFIDAVNAKPGTQTFQAISIAMVGAIMFGVDCGNFGSVIGFKDFKTHWCCNALNLPCTTEDGGCFGDDDGKGNLPHSWIRTFVMLGNVLITVGAAIGAVTLSPVIAKNYGRRMCISVGSFVTFIGCLLSVFSFSQVGIFYFSRFVTGFGVGVTCYALPMYNSEMATPKIRGRTGGLFQFNVVLGGLIATILTAFVQVWEVGMMLPGVFGLVVSLAVWTVPESPRWALQNQGRPQALEILRRIRVGEVEPELDAISEAIEIERNLPAVSWGQLCGKGLRTRVFVACYLQVAQQMTGVNAVLGNSNIFFTKLGIPAPYTFNIIWNIVMFVGIICGLGLIDSSMGGRRSQLMVATVVMGPPLLITAGALVWNFHWIIGALMLCVYAFAFQFAWGVVPWVYPSEIFSMSERIAAMGIAVFFQYGINTLVYFTSPIMIDWSMPATCLIFGLINITNLIFVCSCVLETKGIPLEDIPKLFGDAKVGGNEAPLAGAREA